MLYNLRVQADVVHLVSTLFLFLFTCAEEGGERRVRRRCGVQFYLLRLRPRVRRS